MGVPSRRGTTLRKETSPSIVATTLNADGDSSALISISDLGSKITNASASFSTASPRCSAREIAREKGSKCLRQHKRKESNGNQIHKGEASSRQSFRDVEVAAMKVNGNEVNNCSLSAEDVIDEACVRGWLQHNQLVGQVRSYASESRGSRLVQVALQLFAFEDDTKVKELVLELQGWATEAVNSPHANHVLQKAIEVARPECLQFLVPELLACFGSPADIAKHRFGCRVLERLFEHFPPASVERILFFYKVEECNKKARCTCKAGRCVEGLLKDAATVQQLSEHMYASFVLQHIMEHGEPAAQRKIVNALIGHPDDKDPGWSNSQRTATNFLTRAVANQNARGLLDKALTYGSPEGQRKLAEMIVDTEGELVKDLALTRYTCHDAGIRLFHVLPKGGHHWNRARQQISQHYDQIKKQVYSKDLFEAAQLVDCEADGDDVVPDYALAHRSDAGCSRSCSSRTSPMRGAPALPLAPGTIMPAALADSFAAASLPSSRWWPNVGTMPKPYSSQQQPSDHAGPMEKGGLTSGALVQQKAAAVGLSLQQLLPKVSHQHHVGHF